MLRKATVTRISHGYHHADLSEILAVADDIAEEVRADADREYAVDWARRHEELREQIVALGLARPDVVYNKAITDVLNLIGKDQRTDIFANLRSKVSALYAYSDEDEGASTTLNEVLHLIDDETTKGN
jgi:hypothetical protein